MLGGCGPSLYPFLPFHSCAVSTGVFCSTLFETIWLMITSIAALSTVLKPARTTDGEGGGGQITNTISDLLLQLLLMLTLLFVECRVAASVVRDDDVRVLLRLAGWGEEENKERTKERIKWDPLIACLPACPPASIHSPSPYW